MTRSNAAKKRDTHSGPKAVESGGDLRPTPVGDLDRLIHEKVRLKIVSALAVNQSLTFNDLKRLLGTTDGNLSVHARKLEDAGYITCTKSFEGRMPKTEYALSSTGRKAFEKYLDHMEALLDAMRHSGDESHGDGAPVEAKRG